MNEEKELLCTRRSKSFVSVGNCKYKLKTLNEQYPIQFVERYGMMVRQDPVVTSRKFHIKITAAKLKCSVITSSFFSIFVLVASRTPVCRNKGKEIFYYWTNLRTILSHPRDRFDQLALMRRLADNVWDDKKGCYNGAEEDMETAPPAKRKPGNRYKNQVKIQVFKYQIDLEYDITFRQWWISEFYPWPAFGTYIDFSLCR